MTRTTDDLSEDRLSVSQERGGEPSRRELVEIGILGGSPRSEVDGRMRLCFPSGLYPVTARGSQRCSIGASGEKEVRKGKVRSFR
jgi:hypothetical protein